MTQIQPQAPVSDIAFTPTVKAEQERRGSRATYADMERGGGWQARITADLAAFVAERDSFYLATANAAGQPYIQHRGGPKGFLQVLDERHFGFADYAGNRQYITLGNLTENPKAYLFLMDYANQRRIKVWGRARAVEDDAELIARLRPEGYRARVERAIVFEVEAWDVNCKQHILPRYDAEALAPAFDRLTGRIEALEAQLRALGADPGAFELPGRP